jgi:hypothetical protein
MNRNPAAKSLNHPGVQSARRRTPATVERFDDSTLQRIHPALIHFFVE